MRLDLGIDPGLSSEGSPRKSGSTGMASSTVRNSTASKKSSDATFVNLSGEAGFVMNGDAEAMPVGPEM